MQTESGAATRLNIGNYPPGRIAVPCTEVLWTRSAVALFQMVSNAPSGAGAFFDWHSFPTIEKRNYIVERFLQEEDLKWLLMIDSDMVPPPDLVARLLHAANHPGRDIVTALCFTRHGFPYQPAAGYWSNNEDGFRWMPAEEFDGQVREVDWVGTGCILVWRPVLECMRQIRGKRIFRGIEHDGLATGRGEDQEFSKAAGTAGFRLFCDTSTVAGHLGLTNVDLKFTESVRNQQGASEPVDCHGRVR